MTEESREQKQQSKLMDLRRQHDYQCAVLGSEVFLLDSLPGRIQKTKDRIRTLVDQIERAEAKVVQAPVTTPVTAPEAETQAQATPSTEEAVSA